MRGAVADCIGAIARQRGTAVFDAVCPQITASIQSSFVSTSHVSPSYLPSTRPIEACMSDDITHFLICVRSTRRRPRNVTHNRVKL